MMHPSSSPAPLWALLLFNLLYILLFGIHFLENGNTEFLLYVAQMLVLVGLIAALHLRFRFSMPLLLAATAWGLLHMLGGSTLLTGEHVLYSLVLIPLWQTGDATLLSYDQIVHFYCYVVVTCMLHHIFRQQVLLDTGRLTLATLTFFAAVGVGALNEIIEFISVLALDETGVGGYYNTLWDLVFNTLGAALTVVLLSLRDNKTSTV